MGLIVLDTTRIKSSLIPSIEKSKNNFDDSIDTINCAINNYSEKNDEVCSNLEKVKVEINNISKKIDNIKKEVQNKVIEKERIDNKNNSSFKTLTNTINAIEIGKSVRTFTTDKGNVKSGININIDSRYKKTDESTKSKMTQSKVTSVNNNSRNRKSIVETASKVTEKKPKTFIGRVGSALKKTGAVICTGVKAAWNGLKSLFKKGRDIAKRTLASLGNVVLSFSKGVVNFVESIGDFGLMAASAAGTVFTGAKDIVKGAVTGNWDFKNTKDLWDGTKAAVKYNWSDKLDQKLGLRQKLDKYAYSPFKTTGTIGKVAEGVGYITGVLILTGATAGAGSTVLAAGGGNGLVAGSAAASATGATLTVSSSAFVSGGIAAAAGVGKNTAAAWNDGASILGGLGYGITKGLYEGAEMTIGYAINGFKPFKGTGMASQVGNTGVHVALDAADGASGAFMDPLFSMIYSPNEENKAQIMYCVNYDKNGNKISDKKWEDLSFSEKYAALFKLRGGWSNVGIQAASAAVISLVSEMPDIASVKRANATYKKMSADGLTDATVTSIQNLKGNSLKNFLTKADQGGKLGLVTSKLTAKQLTKTFSLLDKVTLRKVIDNISESQVHEIIETAKTTTLDLFTKNLSTDRIRKLNNEEFEKIKKYLTTEQLEKIDIINQKSIEKNVHTFEPKTKNISYINQNVLDGSDKNYVYYIHGTNNTDIDNEIFTNGLRSRYGTDMASTMMQIDLKNTNMNLDEYVKNYCNNHNYEKCYIIKIPKKYMGYNANDIPVPIYKVTNDRTITYLTPSLIVGSYDNVTKKVVANTNYNPVFNPNGLHYSMQQIEGLMSSQNFKWYEYAVNRKKANYEELIKYDKKFNNWEKIMDNYSKEYEYSSNNQVAKNTNNQNKIEPKISSNNNNQFGIINNDSEKFLISKGDRKDLTIYNNSIEYKKATEEVRKQWGKILEEKVYVDPINGKQYKYKDLCVGYTKGRGPGAFTEINTINRAWNTDPKKILENLFCRNKDGKVITDVYGKPQLEMTGLNGRKISYTYDPLTDIIKINKAGRSIFGEEKMKFSDLLVRVKSQTEALNEAFSLNDFQDSMVLGRGMSIEGLSSYGIKLTDSAEEIYKKLTKNGNIYSDNGFMSATPIADAGLLPGADVQLIINTKKGANLGFLSDYGYSHEVEVTLGSGSKFNISNVMKSNDNKSIYIFLDQI